MRLQLNKSSNKDIQIKKWYVYMMIKHIQWIHHRFMKCKKKNNKLIVINS